MKKKHFIFSCLLAGMIVISSCGSNSGTNSNSVNGRYFVSTPLGDVSLQISGDSYSATIRAIEGNTYSSGTISADGYLIPNDPFSPFEYVGKISGNTVYYLNHRMEKL